MLACAGWALDSRWPVPSRLLTCKPFHRKKMRPLAQSRVGHQQDWAPLWNNGSVRGPYQVASRPLPTKPTTLADAPHKDTCLAMVWWQRLGGCMRGDTISPFQGAAPGLGSLCNGFVGRTRWPPDHSLTMQATLVDAPHIGTCLIINGGCTLPGACTVRPSPGGAPGTDSLAQRSHTARYGGRTKAAPTVKPTTSTEGSPPCWPPPPLVGTAIVP